MNTEVDEADSKEAVLTVLNDLLRRPFHIEVTVHEHGFLGDENIAATLTEEDRSFL